MRLIRSALVIAAMALFFAPTGGAHALVKCSTAQTPQQQLNCGELNVHHGTTSLRFLDNHPTVGTRKSRKSLADSSAFLIRYGNRHTEWALARMLPPIDSCLMEIIRREASGFRPDDKSTWTRAAMKWNGGHVAPWTSGTTYGGSGAYGVPQALPGSKMESAGADWATNPWTQIKWMRGYVGKYGGSCGALAYHSAHGYY